MFSALQRKETEVKFAAIASLGIPTLQAKFEQQGDLDHLAAILSIEQIDQAIQSLMDMRKSKCLLEACEDVDPNILAWESREESLT